MEILEYERAGWIDAQLMFATETRMMYGVLPARKPAQRTCHCRFGSS